ncbi:MAG: DUF2065 domain-containing protein [Rhizobiaceae bacterium]|nr:DUF2065 domain-containing protein [Rhizobiaceae bacterium]
MSELVVAIGLVFVIEGLVYAVFPNAMRNMVNEMARMPDQTLRTCGLFAVGLGVFIVWLVKG